MNGKQWYQDNPDRVLTVPAKTLSSVGIECEEIRKENDYTLYKFVKGAIIGESWLKDDASEEEILMQGIAATR
jgi:hypothetical protein